MVKQTSSGITVSVETLYQPQHSNPLNSEFLFLYRILIENNTAFSVQLVSRKWVITDANGTQRIVEGEGVVGQQPILHPGQQHEYVSASNIKTEMGKMVGYYIMRHLSDNTSFIVAIPEFQLVVPFKLN